MLILAVNLRCQVQNFSNDKSSIATSTGNMASTEQCPKINQGAIIALGVLCGLLFFSVSILLLLLARIIEGRLDRLDRRRNRRSESDEYLDDADLDADRRHRRFLWPRTYSRDTIVAAPELVCPTRTGLGRGLIRYRSGQWRGHANVEAFRDRMRRNQLIHRRVPPIQYPIINAASLDQAMQQPFRQESQLPAQQIFEIPLGIQRPAQHVVMPSPRLQQAVQNNIVQPPEFQQPLQQEAMQSPRLQQPTQQEILRTSRFQQPEQQGDMPSPRGNFLSRRNSGRNNINSGGLGRLGDGSDGGGEDNGALEEEIWIVED